VQPQTVAPRPPQPIPPQPGLTYAGQPDGHWVQKNIERGEYILLEDGSLWEIDRLERLNASLWLRMSRITVLTSSRGSPGCDYLLVNVDDREKAHAKCVGRR